MPIFDSLLLLDLSCLCVLYVTWEVKCKCLYFYWQTMKSTSMPVSSLKLQPRWWKKAMNFLYRKRYVLWSFKSDLVVPSGFVELNMKLLSCIYNSDMIFQFALSCQIRWFGIMHQKSLILLFSLRFIYERR